MKYDDLELNIDALPGITHHYGGHAFGNIPSMDNKEKKSFPKQAALQSLEKMRAVYLCGTPQMVFPPHFRPCFSTLKGLGFSGSEEKIIAQAVRSIPEIYYKLCSSAAMWMANAATVSSAADTEDGKVHITPANLSSSLHRAIESSFNALLFKKAFPLPQFFTHHEQLPYGQFFPDEGAANILHLSSHFSTSSVTLFTWGRKSLGQNIASPKKFPARQSLEACEAIARQHKLNEATTFFSQQSPEAIDAGSFHLDLCASAHKKFLLLHEKSFIHTASTVKSLQQTFENKHNESLCIRKIAEEELPLKEALQTFFFNSQFATAKDGKELLFCSRLCQENPKTAALLNELEQNPQYPINEVHFVNLSQSLQGGGGPGCLRLRVPLPATTLAHVHTPLLFDEVLYQRLKRWIEENYPESLVLKDLSDPVLIEQEKRALDSLTKTLRLGSIYPFQQ